MNKHIIFGVIGVMIAAALIVVGMGLNRAEAPLVNETVNTEPETISGATTTIDEVVMPPTEISATAPAPVVEEPVAARGCVVGGCSSQLCVEEGEDPVTTCEWTAKYSCYQKATCERQTTGECGWTETPELRQCLVESVESARIELQN